MEKPVELPFSSVDVPPVDIAFKHFMDDKVDPENPIPKFTAAGLECYSEIRPSSVSIGVNTVGPPKEDNNKAPPPEAPSPVMPAPPPVTQPQQPVPHPPPTYAPHISQGFQQAVPMEVEEGGLKRQISPAEQLAVAQPQRASPFAPL